MNSEVIVNIDDIKKAVYFISNLTQMQGTRPMRGALNSKAIIWEVSLTDG